MFWIPNFVLPFQLKFQGMTVQLVVRENMLSAWQLVYPFGTLDEILKKKFSEKFNKNKNFTIPMMNKILLGFSREISSLLEYAISWQ